MDFASFDDYWTPFLSGATPSSSYAETLSVEARQKLIARLRKKVLGDGPDRPFALPPTPGPCGGLCRKTCGPLRGRAVVQP